MNNDSTPSNSPGLVKPKATELFKESFKFLNSDKDLVLFPIISCVLSVIGVILVGILYLIVNHVIFNDKSPTVLLYLMIFIYYLVIYFISIYFNVGLVACVLRNFQGQPSSFKYGLDQANVHRKTILGYSLIAATVGLILNIIANSNRNVLGRVLANVAAAAWSIATIFIAPVIVTTNSTPTQSIEYSARIFKENWGNTVKGSIGFILFSFVGIIIVLIPAVLGFIISNPFAIVFGVLISFIGLVAVILIASTCTAIYRAALFHYAITKTIPPGFSQNLPLAVNLKK